MEENNEQPNNTNAEEVKETVKDEQVETNNTDAAKKKDEKNINLKKEASEAKNFITNIFKTPYTEMEKICNNPKSFLKIAIAIIIVWVVIECIGGIISIFNSFSYSYYSNVFAYFMNSFSDMFRVIKAILIPVIVVALLSGIIYLVMKNKKKNYLTILTTVIVAKIPVVLASILSLYSGISSEVYKITSSFSGLCNVVSTILIYFAIKALYGEKDDNKVAKTFLIVMAIYYGIALVLKFFNLYI